MRNHKFLKATLDDACIVNDLRDGDIAEMNAQGLVTPLESILGAIKFEETYIVWHNGKRQAICGSSRDGISWGMTTKDFIENHPKEFYRASVRFINHMTRKHGEVKNYIWSGNTVHINWLKKLGFTIFEDQPLAYPGSSEIFYYFTNKEM